MEYKLISVIQAVELGPKMTELTEEGWEPHGNHCVTKDGDFLLYTQLMKRVICKTT